MNSSTRGAIPRAPLFLLAVMAGVGCDTGGVEAREVDAVAVATAAVVSRGPWLGSRVGVRVDDDIPSSVAYAVRDASEGHLSIPRLRNSVRQRKTQELVA